MMDPERMDLSPLDPARDPERWSRVVAVTRMRVEAALLSRASADGVLDQLGAWSRPILAAAAILALVLGTADAVIASRPSPLDRASEARRMAVLSDHSLGRGQRPTGGQLLVALRSRSAR
jgi:hypothetical protein